ncbi:Ldh family oxidoreductase [Aquabacterium sp. OR-4]|uniref:Ldh family oxidoreductase n=1 Tax=Aquabacterium sp. OR-4 TaxID=2978127 RepID=UPI0021B1E51C|nr:Ldh family oxidoreductase [Aquabacterium sp. OR-4]MDT7838470.1 Ldh family oxidoreductase [Aquabacterium sp. OR-4]
MSHPIAAGSIPVQHDTLRTWASACLQAVDMPPDDAAELADSLVQTSLWGVDSHGIARLTHYLDRLSRGSIKARPQLQITRSGPCTAQVAGDAGQGIVVAHKANRLAMEIARENGIAAVGVNDSSHCGAIGLYTRAAARQGFVAFAFTHADSIAAPHGGTRPFFGTNPISIAFPRARAGAEPPQDGPVPLGGQAQGAVGADLYGEPTCLDMATTSIPWNRVMNARREGHPLPPDVAIDGQGRPTTDADAAIAVTPLGGEQYGHKGYAMALMVDLLCGPLNGAPFGAHIPPMFKDLDAPRRIGAFFIVIDPARFAGGAMLAAVVAQLAGELAAEPGSPRLPGDPERDHDRQRRAQGIPIEPALAEQMRAWSTRLGVTPPL